MNFDLSSMPVTPEPVSAPVSAAPPAEAPVAEPPPEENVINMITASVWNAAAMIFERKKFTSHELAAALAEVTCRFKLVVAHHDPETKARMLAIIENGS